MSAKEQLMDVTTISGDREIAQILNHQALFAFPAFAGNYDGFVNDTFSEYANPSIVRPMSVRNANISSVLSVYFYREDADTSSSTPPSDEQTIFDFKSP